MKRKRTEKERKFCPRSCQHLSMTEEEQSQYKVSDDKRSQNKHLCMKFQVAYQTWMTYSPIDRSPMKNWVYTHPVLFHKDAHPELYRCELCDEP